jgi:phage major head subunit gpT-like protein
MAMDRRDFDLAFRGFKTLYTDALAAAPAHAEKVAMTVTGSAGDETHGWVGSFPQLREWIGPRVVHTLSEHAFTIVNRDFESTVSVKCNDLADDRLGVYRPMFSELGRLTAQHKEQMIFGLLARGFTAEGYDGQPFFDTAHPLAGEGGVALWSNAQVPADPQDRGPAWFLLDKSRALRPIIRQERQSYDLVARDRPGDDTVFFDRELVHGVDARANAGVTPAAARLCVRGRPDGGELRRRPRRHAGLPQQRRPTPGHRAHHPGGAARAGGVGAASGEYRDEDRRRVEAVEGHGRADRHAGPRRVTRRCRVPSPRCLRPAPRRTA